MIPNPTRVIPETSPNTIAAELRYINITNVWQKLLMEPGNELDFISAAVRSH